MKLATILLGAYLTAMPMNHPNLLNKLGQFPMPDVNHLEMISEKNVSCGDISNKKIIIRKYQMNNQIIAMTASRPKSKTYFAVRLINGKIYVDNGIDAGLAEDGFIDSIYSKDNQPGACNLIPEFQEI